MLPLAAFDMQLLQYCQRAIIPFCLTAMAVKVLCRSNRFGLFSIRQKKSPKLLDKVRLRNFFQDCL